MSAATLAFAPLPYDSDPGAAFTETDKLPAVGRATGAGTYFTETIPGEFFFYPLSLGAALFTSAVAGNRTAYYVLLDQNNVEMIRQGLSNFFGPSGAFNLAWEISLGTAYTDNANSFHGPLPPRLLLPTYSVGIVIGNMQAGDTVQGQISSIKIPRRKPIEPTASLIATPRIA